MQTESETEDFLQRPLADIIDEVKRLRAEKNSLVASNNALRHNISALRHNISALRHNISALRHNISSLRLLPDLYASQLLETKSFLQTVVQQYSLQLPSLPPEILLAIFRLTQPSGPACQHPPSILQGPRNPWLDSLKTKKALVLVCKTWSSPATELLYSDIVLRRMGQISALANTFRRDRNQNLANLVRAIRVDMCVVLTHCAEVVREDFEYILTQCTMLHSFVHIAHPLFGFQPPDFTCVTVPTSPAAFNPTWILDLRQRRAGRILTQSLTTRLSTLHLDFTTYEGSFLPLAHLLSSAPCLTYLELGAISRPLNDPPSDTVSLLPYLSFPALKTLCIYCDLIPFVRYVTTKWTMPHLTNLTCMVTTYIPTPLLEAHAKQLTYLHFMYMETPHNLAANVVLLPDLHELCPRILHLVLFIVPPERTALNIHSPTLRYLDICAAPSVEAYRVIALAPTAHAPQLKRVRMVLDMHPFIPRHFHPTHMPGSDRAIEDVSRIPGAEHSDERAIWFLSEVGGMVEDFAEWRIRQHSWAVTVDRSGFGVPYGGFHLGDEDEDETDEDGEYAYESLPSSPVDSGSDMSGGEALEGREGGLVYERDDDRMGRNSDARWHVANQEEDAGSDSDSDMGRAWIKLAEAAPPLPSTVTFVDDVLDSSLGQYDRETILERFSQSQVGDFLLE